MMLHRVFTCSNLSDSIMVMAQIILGIINEQVETQDPSNDPSNEI